MSKQKNVPVAGKKPDNFKESIGKLAKYCKPYMMYIIVAFAFAIVGTVFNLIGPDRLSEITDVITV